MSAIDFNRVFQQFADTKILVVGDVMLDTYWWGQSTRMSPEAPVPVVDIEKTEHRLGGAANVVLNIKSLQAQANLCSVIGNDANAAILKNLLQQHHIDTSFIITSNGRPTTQKNRVMNSQKHAIRFDIESTEDLNHIEEEQFKTSFLKAIANQPQVIILQDYNKGILSENVIQYILEAAAENHIPVVVDPKKKNFFAYKNVALFKPNLKETQEALHIHIDKENDEALYKAAENLQQKLHTQKIIITLSEKGILGYEPGKQFIYAAHPRNIVDVSGAGDTVIAVIALCLAQQLPFEYIAQLANIAGGLVCEQPGVGVLDFEELKLNCKGIL